MEPREGVSFDFTNLYILVFMQNNANNKKTVMNNNQEKAANGLSLSEIRKVVADQMHGYGSVDGLSMTKLVKLLGSAITSKKAEYDLSFVKDDGVWYIDLPNWPWKRGNLAMVCGADMMLDLLSATPENDKGLNRVKLHVKPASAPVDHDTLQQMLKENWVELTQQESSLTGGATYTLKGKIGADFKMKDYWTGESKPRTLWLCPVTLFIFGEYPKYFYGRVIK